jgi:alkylation response protein AidB-like acyl-CoA dehydrogenase
MNFELTRDQQVFREQIEQFARDVVAPRAASIDKTGEYPADVMHAAAGQGLCGVTVPKAWGGGGRDYLSYALAIEAIAKASATVAVALSVTNSLVGEVIAHAGRDQQRDKWLRKLAAGEVIGAFALSEPDAGTDAANQKTTATRTANGYRIKGKKVWVANAEEAAVAIVFACTRPGLRGQGVTAFLVPMTAPGITRTARADSLGVRGLGCMDLELDIEGRRRPGIGPRRSGVPSGDVGVAGRPRGDCGAGAGDWRSGDQRGDRLRQTARTVRPADRQLSSDSMDARRHGHRARRGADADVQGRGGERRSGKIGHRSIDGQARCL